MDYFYWVIATTLLRLYIEEVCFCRINFRHFPILRSERKKFWTRHKLELKHDFLWALCHSCQPATATPERWPNYFASASELVHCPSHHVAVNKLDFKFCPEGSDSHESGTIKAHDCSHVIASLAVVHSMWLNPEDLDQIIDSHCRTPVVEKKKHFIPNTSLLFSVWPFSIDHYFSIFPVSLNCSAGPSETAWLKEQTKRNFANILDFFQDLPRDSFFPYNAIYYNVSNTCCTWYCFNRCYNKNVQSYRVFIC